MRRLRGEELLLEPARWTIGMIHVTPKRRDPGFTLELSSGSVVTEDLIFCLSQLHDQYGCKKIVLVWDNLRAHKSAENHFREKNRGWSDFECFPTYSLELNPFENCWNRIKRSDLANFVSESGEQLSEATSIAAQRIDSDSEFLQACFKHAKLKL